MENKLIHLWDLPLRLFHWLLVIVLVAAFVTGEVSGLWLYWHSYFGVFILALITFRIAWGFLGSTYARFTTFIPTPSRWKEFVSSGWSGVGHSPLGGLSVFALLGITLAQAGLGLFANNDDFDFHGPLYGLVSNFHSDRLTHWHTQLINVLSILVGLHVIAILYYTCIKRKDLVLPMITGTTFVAEKAAYKPVYGGGMVRFLLAITIAGTVFLGIKSGILLQYLSPPSPALQQLPPW